MDNLERLHRKTDTMDLDSKAEYRAYFIGCLSALVDEDVWDDAMHDAEKCMDRYSRDGIRKMLDEIDEIENKFK